MFSKLKGEGVLLSRENGRRWLAFSEVVGVYVGPPFLEQERFKIGNFKGVYLMRYGSWENGQTKKLGMDIF